jgi:hypothetical protein
MRLYGNARLVEAGGMRLIDSIDHNIAVFGVYVVRADTSACPFPSASDNSGCATWRVLARVTDVPGPQPSPTWSPTPAPATPAPPATPIALPSAPAGGAPVGLMGLGDRPLTAGEFATLWAADPTHLAGRIVIVKGPVPTGFQCWDAGAADAGISPPPCHIAILDGQLAADGHYWAVRVGPGGALGVVGELKVPQSSFVFKLADALAARTNAGQGDLMIVDAWLDWEPSLACDMPSGDPLCQAGATWSRLTSAPLLQPNGDATTQLDVQFGAYQVFGSKDLEARPIHGLYLVQTSDTSATILARLETVTP